MNFPRYRTIILGLALTGLGGAMAVAVTKPSAVKTVLAAASAIIPSGPVVTVHSVEELSQEARKAKGRVVIRLAPGNYQGAYIGGVKNDAGIVIESADPANPAVIDGLTIKDSSGITLRNIMFTRVLGIPGQQYLVLIFGSSNISVQNVELIGNGDPAIDKMISALMIRNCRDVEVTDSRLSRFRYALTFLSGKNIRIARNELRDLRTDAIRGGGVDNLTVENNVIGNFSPAKGDHPDGIQLWSNNESKPARNIVIRDNLVVRDQGGVIQGIFIRDTKRQLPFEDVSVSGNLIIGSLFNGISIDGGHGVAITDNVVIPVGGQKSWIRVERADDVELVDNRAMMFVIGKEARVSQHGSKHAKPGKGDMSDVIRKWMESKPGLKAKPGPYLRQLAGLPTE